MAKRWETLREKDRGKVYWQCMKYLESYFDRIGLDEGGNLWTRWNLKIPTTSLETLGIFLYSMKSRLLSPDSDDPINSLP